ncbi:MAG: WD40 repeat domain-containing protein, partial [Planctomycetes bacterium]|nr:WD40 repeat domain-containing protein [Planctomycetota bacterium]
HHRAPRTAEFDPTGERVVTASLDGLTRVYRLPDTEPALVLAGHDNDVRHARFSPDGRIIATSSWDQTCRLWDAANGKLLRVLSGHRQSVECADFSPDGRTIVTGSLDGTARLWDVESGETIAVTPFPSPVYTVAFRRDGREFAVAGDADVVRFWPYPPRSISEAGTFRQLSPIERARYGLPSSDEPSESGPSSAARGANDVANDLWQRLRDLDEPTADDGPAGERERIEVELATLTERTSPEYTELLFAVLHTRSGAWQLALDEAEHCNRRSLERTGREDPVALATEGLALDALGQRDRARTKVEAAERLTHETPWTWSGDPDPASYVRSALRRVGGAP